MTLELERIIADGEARAGSSADRDAAWLPALELLVRSANDEGGLSGPGEAAMARKLSELLGERLVAEQTFAREAAIRARPLPIRFVVAGLARSGTTFLHRLLACDPDVEHLPTWQAFRPVPPRDAPDERRAEVVAMIDGLRSTNPDAFRIHPIEADAPEEEVFLLQHSFASMLFGLTCPLPSYMAWLSRVDHREAYEFAFDLLRLNEHAAGVPEGRPRVMKSPQFVLDLKVMTELAPSAVYVQNHRDPVDLVGSYCSTYAASRARSCEVVDLHALGRERLDHLATMASRAMAARRAASGAGGTTFVDVHYHRLVAAPLDVIDELYTAAGIPLGSVAKRSMGQWLAEHPQHAGGAHRYDLGDYGLDRRTIEASLAEYIERFQPGVEP